MKPTIKLAMKSNANSFRKYELCYYHTASSMIIKKNAFNRYYVYHNSTFNNYDIEFNTLNEAKEYVVDLYFSIYCDKKNK